MEYDLNEYFVLLLYVFLWFKYMVRYTTIIDSYYCNYCIHTADDGGVPGNIMLALK